MLDLSFYREKKVLITGHTGFKGSWMCRVLADAGAKVIGYALEAPTAPSLFELIGVEKEIISVIGDIRDLPKLKEIFLHYEPEIVIHMAAQPLVRESYRNPVYTYDVNIMGTVNILECVRITSSVRSFLNVTTDKVYRNKEWEWGYRENEELNGYDPYSNSKSCSELVTDSYLNSFFKNRDIAISTVRAGNVIGGGDFSVDRIIPDCIRAVQDKQKIIVRNPYSVRPYQYVLEPLMAYLLITQEQYQCKEYAGNYNVGPDEDDCINTGDLVTLFCEEWSKKTGSEATWKNEYDGGPHEAEFLKLDCSKMKKNFGWRPVWKVNTAIQNIVEWSCIYYNEGNVSDCMRRQIEEYLKGYVQVASRM